MGYSWHRRDGGGYRRSIRYWFNGDAHFYEVEVFRETFGRWTYAVNGAKCTASLPCEEAKARGEYAALTQARKDGYPG